MGSVPLQGSLPTGGHLLSARPQMSLHFEFVPLEGGQEKPRDDLRRDLIRRQCMRGRNKRVGSRRTQRQIRRSARDEQSSQVGSSLAAVSSDAASSSQTVTQTEPRRKQTFVEYEDGGTSSPRTTSDQQHSAQNLLDSQITPFVIRPRSFSDGVVHDCTLSSRHPTSVASNRQIPGSKFQSLKKIIYPIEPYLAFEQNPEFFMWLSLNESYLSTVRFSISAMEDFLQNRSPLAGTWSNLQGAIAQLNKRLSLERDSLQKSTVYTVALLALSASLFYDHDATKAHLLGMHRMVQLLGGLPYLHDNPLVHYKLSRSVHPFLFVMLLH